MRLVDRICALSFGGTVVALLSCTARCPEDHCPSWYDLGAACTEHGTCYTDDGTATCERDHTAYAAPFSCDVVTSGSASRITVDVSSTWAELGTRDDFSAAPGQVMRDYPETAPKWKIQFDGVDAPCDCRLGGGCGCENVPRSVRMITVETSTACPYVSLVFDDRTCVHPTCER